MVVIALSGYGQDEDRGRALKAGFDAHVAKPASPEYLEELMIELVVRNTVAAK